MKLGYKGKQVRDNLHADDIGELIKLIYENKDKINVNAQNVFNMGGGRKMRYRFRNYFYSKRRFRFGMKYSFNNTPN